MLKSLGYFLAVALLTAGSALAQARPPATPPAQPRPSQPPTAPPPAAQTPAPARTPSGTIPVCGGMYQIGPPPKLPPADVGAVVYQVAACFEKQGGYSVVDPQTYLYYMEMVNRRSIPSENRWVPYNEDTEQTIVADFKRLWATSFLDDLSIEVRDGLQRGNWQ